MIDISTCRRQNHGRFPNKKPKSKRSWYIVPNYMKQFVLNKSWIPTLINKKLTISNHICFLLVVYCTTKTSTSNLPHCACTNTLWELKEKRKKKLKEDKEQKLTAERISFASPFSYEGGPTLASRMTWWTEPDIN